MKKEIIKLLMLSVILILSACAGQGQTLDQTPIDPIRVRQPNYAGYEQESINRWVLDQFDEVIEVTSVMNKNEILLAFKASTFHQLNERKLEGTVTDELKQLDPDLKATVSSDEKFFIEIDRLKYDIRDNNLSQADYDVQFAKVKDIVIQSQSN